jgi:hypothetical protein
MGTRNLTMVISGGKTKIAQYGQWDGYPSGQGKTVLEFLRNTDLKGFKEKAESLEWLTPEQVEQIDAIKNWDEKYPYLSRDAGAQILRAVGEGKMTVF